MPPTDGICLSIIEKMTTRTPVRILSYVSDVICEMLAKNGEIVQKTGRERKNRGRRTRRVPLEIVFVVDNYSYPLKMTLVSEGNAAVSQLGILRTKQPSRIFKNLSSKFICIFSVFRCITEPGVQFAQYVILSSK